MSYILCHMIHIMCGERYIILVVVISREGIYIYYKEDDDDELFAEKNVFGGVNV